MQLLTLSLSRELEHNLVIAFTDYLSNFQSFSVLGTSWFLVDSPRVVSDIVSTLNYS